METIVNLIANSLIVLGMLFFIIGVFGRKSKVIDSMHPVEKFLLKLALCGTAAGSLFNLLTVSTPQNSEIVLNVGLAFLFVWAAWFHWKYFVNSNKNQ